MSVTKKVALGNLDYDLLREVALTLGYHVQDNVKGMRMYGGRTEDVDMLCSKSGRSYGVGFRRTADGNTEAVYDSDVTDTYSDLICGYAEERLKRIGGDRFEIVNKAKTRDKIILTVRR